MKVPMPYLHILLAVTLLALAHWFPHLRVLIGKPVKHPVRLKTNYTIGILFIFGPVTDWLVRERPTDPIQIAIVMWVFIFAGGLAVVAMYALDDLVNWLVKIRNEREEHELRKRQADAEQIRKQ